jgi:hypothetical protein
MVLHESRLIFFVCLLTLLLRCGCDLQLRSSRDARSSIAGATLVVDTLVAAAMALRRSEESI